MKNELPEGWKEVFLADILKSIENGNRPKGGIKHLDKGIPSLGGEHLNRLGGFNFDKIKLIPNEFYGNLKRGKIEKNDVLVVKDGATTGKTSFVDDSFPYEKAAVNEHVFILRCKNKQINQKYLFYHLRSQYGQKQIKRDFHGAAIGGINTQFVKNYKLPLPPLKTQHNIVAILEKAEETKKHRAQADGLTQQLLKSVFLEMFGESFDKDWFMSNIEGVIHPTKGSIRTGPFGSQLLHGEFVEEGIAVLGIDNAVKNEFQWSKRRFISESKYNELKRYTVHPGDVLITIMGTCGRCAIVPDDIPIAINTKHLCCITLNQEKCLPIYLNGYFLQHPIARHYLSLKANGAIMDGLNMRIIKEMPILIPPIELQRKYAAIVQKLNETKQYQQQSSQEVDLLLNALMQKAFTGELLA